VHDVGTLAGSRIVDVFYNFLDRRKPELGTMRWKSILVQRGADQYVEIYHLQATYNYLPQPLAPTKIVHVGDELVLMTQDSDGGNEAAAGRRTGGLTLRGRTLSISPS
jgi:hypothetical protein